MRICRILTNNALVVLDERVKSKLFVAKGLAIKNVLAIM